MSFAFIPANERRLSILIFHRVRPIRDSLFPGEPDRDDFDKLMKLVAQNFTCFPLNQAIEMLSKGQLFPRNAIAITFDDGYADNRTEALPILKRYGLTATFFIASGYIDGGCMWNDQAIELVRNYQGEVLDLRPLGLEILASKTDSEKTILLEQLIPFLKYKEPDKRRYAIEGLLSITGGTIPADLMMSCSQVREMDDAGMCIGGHTMTHPILATLDSNRVRQEIHQDRERLTAIIGRPPLLFAYPNGKPGKDYLPEHRDIVRDAGYQAAFTTSWGAVTQSTDLFQIPRFTPWEKSPLRFGLRLAQNYLRTSAKFSGSP